MANGPNKPTNPVTTQGGGNKQPISEETLKTLLDVQKQELTLRGKEFEIRLKEIEHNSSHAEKILQTQERDRASERHHQRCLDRNRHIAAGIALFLLVAVIVVGMYLNKDDLVGDIIKIVGGLVTGAIGGYGYAVSKHKRQEKETDD